MSGRRLIAVDPLTGIESYAHYSFDGDALTVEDVQDVAPVIESAKARVSENKGWSKNRNWRLAAEIPAVIADKLWREGIMQNPERLKRWMRDPDNRDFCNRNKTSNGILFK